MNKNSIYELYQKITDYCNKLEEANYDCYKTYPPVSEDELSKWESDNQIILPIDLKNWYLLSNGFDMGSTAEILPLQIIKRHQLIEAVKIDDGIIVGYYSGDGSALLIDKHGSFFELDHGDNQLYQMTFEGFLQEWVIDHLEDYMYEAGLL